jgi:hypothetical protein
LPFNWYITPLLQRFLWNIWAVVNPPAHDKSKDHNLPRCRGARPDVSVGGVGNRHDAALDQQGLLGHVRP